MMICCQVGLLAGWLAATLGSIQRARALNARARCVCASHFGTLSQRARLTRARCMGPKVGASQPASKPTWQQINMDCNMVVDYKELEQERDARSRLVREAVDRVLGRPRGW